MANYGQITQNLINKGIYQYLHFVTVYYLINRGTLPSQHRGHLLAMRHEPRDKKNWKSIHEQLNINSFVFVYSIPYGFAAASSAFFQEVALFFKYEEMKDSNKLKTIKRES